MALPSFLQRHRDRGVLIACLALSITLLRLPSDLRFTMARGLGSLVYAPADGAVWLSAHLGRLQSENEALRERLMTLADEAPRSEEYKLEAGRLRRLLDFRERESYRFLPAELLSYPLDFRERNLLRIDRGQRDGVELGMPVVSPAGLLGAVFDVHERHSEVQLLASKDFSVSCRDRRSRVLGVFKWDPRRGFRVDWVDLGEDVRVGDLFMTSGLGSRFPEGFLLGTVREVNERPGALRREILIEPSVSLQHLEDVFVVTAIGEAAPGFPLPAAGETDSLTTGGSR
jgi:rod shape-determining protein MreC